MKPNINPNTNTNEDASLNHQSSWRSSTNSFYTRFAQSPNHFEKEKQKAHRRSKSDATYTLSHQRFGSDASTIITDIIEPNEDTPDRFKHITTRSYKMMHTSPPVTSPVGSPPSHSTGFIINSSSSTSTPVSARNSTVINVYNPNTLRKEVKNVTPNLFATEKGSNFCYFLTSGDFSDINLVYNDKKYKAHKLILSYSSSFFRQLFLSDPSINEFNIELPIDDGYAVISQILEFIYSGKITITEENAIQLFSLSDMYKIGSLRSIVSDFLTSKVTRENVFIVLKKSLQANNTDMIDKCVLVIAKHFCYIYDITNITQLPFTILLRVLKHDMLNIKNEYDLYKVVCQWVDVNKENMNHDQLSSLFEDIRYALIGYQKLQEVIKNPLVPRESIVKASLLRLAHWESPKKEEEWKVIDRRYQQRDHQSITIDYDGKGKGIFRWIGTNGEREEWQNPTTRGVKVFASSIERGQPMDLVRKLDQSELWTKDVPSSWFAIDLSPRRVIPTYYTLVHGGNYEADILRNWHFQGSNDGETWTILCKHQNDASLSGRFGSASWPINNVTTPFKMFRILQTGHNSSDRNYLVLAGIEIYGELYEE